MFLRFAKAIGGSLTAPQIDLTDSITQEFRALPSDCDANLHINNARYLRLMDLGRVALVARLGLLTPLVKNRWGAVVGAVEIEFLREIAMFDRFDLVTRIVGWDRKWFYIEQRFEREGRLLAVGRVQGLFRGKKGSVSPAELVAELGPWVTSPGLPPAFSRLAERSSRRPSRLSFSEDDLPGLQVA